MKTISGMSFIKLKVQEKTFNLTCVFKNIEGMFKFENFIKKIDSENKGMLIYLLKTINKDKLLFKINYIVSFNKIDALNVNRIKDMCSLELNKRDADIFSQHFIRAFKGF